MRRFRSKQILTAALSAGAVGALSLGLLKARFLGMQLGDQLTTLALSIYAYAAVAALAAVASTMLIRRGAPSWLSPFTMGAALWVWLAVYLPLVFGNRGPVLSVLLATAAAAAASAALGALARRFPLLAEPQPYAFLLLAVALAWLLAASLSPAALQGAPAPAWLWLLPALAVGFYGALRTRASRRAGRSVALAASLAAACLFAAAIVVRARQPAPVQPGGTRPSHVVLVSVDTLRADHLGCYGSPIVKTPSLDALARESVLFSHAFSAIPLTNPSHTTMLTGVYPGEHGVEGNAPEPILGGHPTLPRLLADHGFETAGFVSSAVLDQRISQLHRSFQSYDDDLGPFSDTPEVLFETPLFQVVAGELRSRTLLRNERRGDETVDAAIRWLGRNARRRFFLFVHLYDPHGPYAAPPPYGRMYDPGDRVGTTDIYDMTQAQRTAFLADPQNLRRMRAAYSGEVSYADAQVGRLVDALRREGILENTLLIVTSDHGESLGEHGYYFDHSLALHDPSLHVPLLVRLPGARAGGTRVPAIVSLVDVTPTVLDVTGVETKARFDGISLLDSLDPARRAKERYVYSMLFGRVSGRAKMLSVRSLSEKYIRVSSHLQILIEVPGHEELYAVATDPGELHNLVSQDPDMLRRMVALAEPLWKRWFGRDIPVAAAGRAGARSGPVGVRNQVRRALKSLGYTE